MATIIPELQRPPDQWQTGVFESRGINFTDGQNPRGDPHPGERQREWRKVMPAISSSLYRYTPMRIILAVNKARPPSPPLQRWRRHRPETAPPEQGGE